MFIWKTNTKYLILLNVFPDFPICKLQFYVQVVPREQIIGKYSQKVRCMYLSIERYIY